MSYFQFNNKKVYYKIKGKGKPILFLHGNSVSSKMFATVINLYKKHYQCILVDFPGHGKSERVTSFETDFWFYNSMVCKALLQKLELNKVLVIGSSGGALVAINLGLENPMLVDNIIADSFEGEYPLETYIKTIRQDRERDKKKISAKLIWFLMHGFDWERIVDLDTDMNIRFYKRNKSFFHKSISRLEIPALLTGSMKDEYCDHLDEIYNSLKKKNDKLKVHLFEAGNHPAMLSNKHEFFKLVQSFIKN